MPVDRSEIEEQRQTHTLMNYQTLLGLLFDNPDSYFSEDEIIEYVDREKDILQIQLLIVRMTGPTEEFPVDVSQMKGQPVYGLDTQHNEPSNRDLGGLDLPDGLNLSNVTALLSDRIEER